MNKPVNHLLHVIDDQVKRRRSDREVLNDIEKRAIRLETRVSQLLIHNGLDARGNPIEQVDPPAPERPETPGGVIDTGYAKPAPPGEICPDA
jgi:hypothetical protein